MNLTICISAAFLILSHAAFCMPKDYPMSSSPTE